MVQALEELGAAVSALPVVEIRELADHTAVDRVIDQLQRYQWLVFTSVNGVEAFLRRLRHQGRDLRAPGIAETGGHRPGHGGSSARALAGAGPGPRGVSSREPGRGVARTRVRGQRVLLARADRGREVLREQLAAVAEVDQVAVYSQVDADSPLDANPVLRQQLRSGQIEYVTLTSSNIARALLRGLDEATRALVKQGTVKLVSISPVTSTAIRELDLPVAAEAREYTTAGVIEALLNSG